MRRPELWNSASQRRAGAPLHLICASKALARSKIAARLAAAAAGEGHVPSLGARGDQQIIWTDFSRNRATARSTYGPPTELGISRIGLVGATHLCALVAPADGAIGSLGRLPECGRRKHRPRRRRRRDKRHKLRPIGRRGAGSNIRRAGPPDADTCACWASARPAARPPELQGVSRLLAPADWWRKLEMIQRDNKSLIMDAINVISYGRLASAGRR